MNQHRLFCCVLLISSASQLVAQAEATKGPVKVFILAVQSNREGVGRVNSKGARNTYSYYCPLGNRARAGLARFSVGPC